MFSKILLIGFIVVVYLNGQNNSLTNSYPSLPIEVINNYKIQVQNLKQIEEDIKGFEDFTKEQNIEFLKMIQALLPSNLMDTLYSKDKKQQIEFVVLNAPLLNYQAYIYLDKYSYNYKLFKKGLNIAKLLYEVFPNNIAYQDTYLWGLVKNNQYKKPQEEYPSLIEKSNNNEEIISHYDYLVSKTKFNPKEHLRSIKSILINMYDIEDKDNLLKLLSEIYTIQAQEKEQFISEVNHTLEKYTYGKVELIENKKTSRKKQPKTIEYTLFDEVLNIKIYYFSNNIYKELKKIIKQNKYKKIVLDLRGNEGGLVSSIINVISAFSKDEKDKKILIVKTKNDEENYFMKKEYILDNTVPLDILVDKNTAKGALYIPAILQKYKRVNIIGNSQQIDNSVRTYYPLNNISNLLLKVKIGQTLDKNKNKLEINR